MEHKRLSGPPHTELDRLAVDWHELQLDLAGRSKHGKLIEAKSGHVMAVEQPEIIIDSVRDVIRQAATVNRVAPQTKPIYWEMPMRGQYPISQTVPLLSVNSNSSYYTWTTVARHARYWQLVASLYDESIWNCLAYRER